MGTWVPESERDESYEIFHTLFLCRVRVIDTMSADYIRQFGMPTTGDNELDRDQAYGKECRYLTINDMVEYHKKSIQIGIVNPEDTLKIHEIIQKFLVPWAELIRTSIIPGDAPLDDLIALDRFADKIYPHAKRFFPDGVELSILAKRMQGMGLANRTTLLKPKENVVQNIVEDAAPQERESFAQTFAKRRHLGQRRITDTEEAPQQENTLSHPFRRKQEWR